MSQELISTSSVISSHLLGCTNVNNLIWYINPQWCTAIIALVLGIIGIFQDRIRNFFFYPKIDVSIRLESPWCQYTPLFKNDHGLGMLHFLGYYMRILIQVKKNKIEDVEIIANTVSKKNALGNFEKLKEFTPLNLRWSHPQPGEIKITRDVIHKDMFKFCDFGYVTKAENLGASGWEKSIEGGDLVRFHMDTEIDPNTRFNILNPGEYEIEFIFSASNMKPSKKKLTFKINNIWDEVIVSNMLVLSELK